MLADAIAAAREAGLLGAKLFGSEFGCDIQLVRGQGAYICGEETSLLRSIEGVPALGVAGRFYTDGSLAGGIVLSAFRSSGVINLERQSPRLPTGVLGHY